MGLRKFKPVTPGTRFKVADTFEDITASKPCKALLLPIKKTGGRNNSGKMTIRQLGGGHKRRYRIIDFKRRKDECSAQVLTVEYDPNRSSRIALIQYTDGQKTYIICPKNLKVGMTLQSGPSAPIEIGNALPLSNIPLGTTVHHIELQPGRGAVFARSAGTSAQVNAKDGKYVTLKMPSGEIRLVLATCRAVIGETSNSDHNLVRSGKAGRTRWLGRRPRVRPVAMNPVDHPMGGGEGRSSGGQPRSRKGLTCKGRKTRRKKNKSANFIVSRRK